MNTAKVMCENTEYLDMTRVAKLTNTSKEMLGRLVSLGDLEATEDAEGQILIKRKDVDTMLCLNKAMKDEEVFYHKGVAYVLDAGIGKADAPKWLVNKALQECPKEEILGKELVPLQKFEDYLCKLKDSLGVSYQDVRKEFDLNLLTMKWFNIVTGIYPHVEELINKRNLVYTEEEYQILKKWYTRFRSQTKERSLKRYVEAHISNDEYAKNYENSVSRKGFYSKKVDVYLMSKQYHEEGLLEGTVEGVRSFWLEDAISRQKFKQTMLDASVIVEKEIGIELSGECTSQDIRNVKNMVKLLSRLDISMEEYLFRNTLTGEQYTIENLRSAFK